MHVFYTQLDPIHMCLAVHTICTCILMTSEQSGPLQLSTYVLT